MYSEGMESSNIRRGRTQYKSAKRCHQLKYVLVEWLFVHLI
jgi:hypothetical protein